jgi:hypothetical protein
LLLVPLAALRMIDTQGKRSENGYIMWQCVTHLEKAVRPGLPSVSGLEARSNDGSRGSRRLDDSSVKKDLLRRQS